MGDIVPIESICRRTFEAQDLVDRYPPRLHDANKRIVFGIASPPGAVHRGRVVFSRWLAPALPETIGSGPSETIFDAKEDLFGYEPTRDDDLVEWYLNFANYDLFSAYGGHLFAQDEMQVAEHPVLASLREALLAEGIAPLTVEHGAPTPILVTGAERRCRIATDRNIRERRPNGLYGNNFSCAGPEAIERATAPIDPPTITNLVAMEAPSYGSGTYSSAEIEYVLRTAITAFGAARIESSRERRARPRVTVHTGFWGCGAYGGNRVLMTLLQLLAARITKVDRLVFHSADPTGFRFYEEAVRILERELLCRSGTVLTNQVVQEIEAMRFAWSVSNGT